MGGQRPPKEHVASTKNANPTHRARFGHKRWVKGPYLTTFEAEKGIKGHRYYLG